MAKGPTTAVPGILTATVVPTGTSAGAVQGSVILYTTSKTVVAVGTLNASGQVTWQVPAALANLSVYAVYGGSTTYATSSSGTLNEGTALASLK